MIFRPAIVLCGASAFTRTIDFSRYRTIADEACTILMADNDPISGLVATKQHHSPFEHCDVVTTTTHKSLRGPRAGMFFFSLCIEEFLKIVDRPHSAEKHMCVCWSCKPARIRTFRTKLGVSRQRLSSSSGSHHSPGIAEKVPVRSCGECHPRTAEQLYVDSCEPEYRDEVCVGFLRNSTVILWTFTSVRSN